MGSGRPVKSSRIVFSTEKGRVCPRCGWPATDCHCSGALEETVPPKITVRLRLETRGRAGKSVTVVENLPRNRAFLEELSRDLKRRCGTGGSAGGEGVELQGDQRERLRELLSRKGWEVEG